ncbi:MAG TPA: hypothetical protein VGG21_06230 [Acidimicrobiales bacterium]
MLIISLAVIVALVVAVSSISRKPVGLAIDHATASTKKIGGYSVGAPIPGTTLSYLQMLSATIGVGISPVYPDLQSEPSRRYLVRTIDGGRSWRVAGVFPKDFYPRATAFKTPEAGYVMSLSQGSLFTTNGGKTWSRVTTSKDPLSISIRGNVVWIDANSCQTAMNGPCSMHLDTYQFGRLAPTSISSIPSNQPHMSQVGPTSGYVIGGSGQTGGTYGKIFVTQNSGKSWRSVPNPCEKGSILGGSAPSLTELFIYCQNAPDKYGSAFLYSSFNAGKSWSGPFSTPGLGLISGASSNGTFLWQLDRDGILWVGDAGGHVWEPDPNVATGEGHVDLAITTYGTSSAWYPVLGVGVYRTLNGRWWRLFK